MIKIKTFSRLFTAFCVMMIMSQAHAQTAEDVLRLSERNPAVGARMIGLSGAGTYAGVADFSALFANPAGLGYLSRTSLSGSLTTLSTRDNLQFVTPQAIDASESDLRSTTLGHLAYLHKVPTSRGSLVLGASLHRSSNFDRAMIYGGMNSTTSITDYFMPYASEYEVREDDEGYYPHFFRDISSLAYRAGAIEFLAENVENGGVLFDQAVFPGTTIQQYGDLLEEGGMNELSLGGAFEAAPNLMVGLSANVIYGKYRFNSIFEELDVNGENSDYVVLLSDAELVGFDELIYEQGFESEVSGVNVRAGISSELAAGIRLGLSVESPTYKNVTENYWEDLTTWFVQGGSLSASREGTFDYTIVTPWRLGAGIAYVRDGLTLAADAEYIDWAQTTLSAELDKGYFKGLNRTIRSTFDPVINTRVGAEYWIQNIALRGGFAFHPDPRKEDLELVNERTDRSRTQISAGLGYRINDQFTVDFGWSRQQFNDMFVPYAFEDAPVVEEDVVRNRFMIGFTARL